MSNIKILDEDTISKIAAGEIIERPLSVVKELIENAIDAGSSEIAVEISDGGKKLIRVSDNGQGMTDGEIKLSAQRHTTSKLGHIDDLRTLQTLGFRGEALHSIASVSKMIITSKNTSNEIGAQLQIMGGKIISVKPCARNKGTTIEVENLFFNTPARFKFLHSSQSETKSVATLVSHFMICYPLIAFSFINGDATIYKTEPNETYQKRISYVFGKDVVGNLLEVKSNLRKVQLYGFLSKPAITFPNRRFQIFYINNRLIKDKTLTIAVDTAYRGLITNGRYAFTVLFLDIPSDEIDVNVHPAKTEIRFVNSHEVHSLIYRAIRETFILQTDVETEKKVFLQLVEDDILKNSAKTDTLKLSSAQGELKLAHSHTPQRSIISDNTATSYSVNNFELIGQFFDTFILIKMKGCPAFIDQHVASERIIYNRLKREKGALPQQIFLLTEPVEVPHYIYSTLVENLQLIKTVGLEIEPFGERAFVIRSSIHSACMLDAASMLISLATEITSAPYKLPENILLDKLYTTTACKLAIQAGQALSKEEMQKLVEELFAEEYYDTCPHGRPIIFEVSRNLLNSWFKRT